MARLHKISMFVLDVNEEYETVNDLIDYAFSRTDANAEHIEAQTVQFPWYDDIILNSGDSTKQDYEDFMDNSKRRHKQVESVLSEKYDLMKKSVEKILDSAGIPVNDENIVEFMIQMESEVAYKMGE